MVGVQACDEQEEIAYNEWMKISLTTLGTIFYAKEMTVSSGYESREYELRKRRLKKAPKIFYRIVMAKFEFGYQMLIEESQYPPVSFINKCRSRVKIREENENVSEEMEQNEMAEYASKIPRYSPKFTLSMVENYEFHLLGDFDLETSGLHVFADRVQVRIEEYKDKKIVIIQDHLEKNLAEDRN